MSDMQNRPGTDGKPAAAMRPPMAALRLSAHQHVALDRLNNWIKDSRDRGGPAPQEAIVAGHYTQDSHGNITAIHGQDGSERFFYDHQQRLVRAQRPGLADVHCAYGEQGRLREIRQAAKLKRFHYDRHGHIVKMERGNAGAAVFRRDAEGRVLAARTPEVGLEYGHGGGAVTRIQQTLRGVAVEATLQRLTTARNPLGVLSAVRLTGLPFPVRYEWDDQARPIRVLLGDQELVRYSYPCSASCVLTFANGWRETGRRQADGCLPERWTLSSPRDDLLDLHYARDSRQRIVTDGVSHYSYDDDGRLHSAGDESTAYFRYRYNDLGTMSEISTPAGVERFHYDHAGRLVQRHYPDLTREDWRSDEYGRVIGIRGVARERGFHYDDADQLTTVHCAHGGTISLLSDAYDRTTLIESRLRRERFFYGPDNQLLAVYTPEGTLLRAYVYGPNGRVLAEIKSLAGRFRAYPLHLDPMGNCRVVTDDQGTVLARVEYSPFGQPSGEWRDFAPIFQNHFWCSELGMYDFAARWYDPGVVGFLTPDSYTGAPDDERLLFGSAQRLARATMRAGLLGEWLRKPVVRLRYAFCWYDPLNHHDADGHWPAGSILLNILGFIWTLPNTLLGLFFEITCIVGEILRLILWLCSGGTSLWESLGFDTAASSRVHAWAIVFRGGWLGSIPGLMGLTFGNVFFVNGKWEDNPSLGGPGDVFPEEYHGSVAIPRREAFYEHMLAHTWQSYAWGPLFYWLPPPGVYLWSIIISGKCDSFLEKDAIGKAGL